MGKAGIAQRGDGRVRYGAAVGDDEGGGQGALLSRQDCADASVDRLPQRGDREFRPGDDAGWALGGGVPVGRTVEEADRADALEIRVEAEVVAAWKHRPGRRQQPRHAADPLPRVDRRLPAARNEPYPVGGTVNDRARRGRYLHHVAPCRPAGRFPGQDDPPQMRDDRAVEDRRLPDGDLQRRGGEPGKQRRRTDCDGGAPMPCDTHSPGKDGQGAEGYQDGSERDVARRRKTGGRPGGHEDGNPEESMAEAGLFGELLRGPATHRFRGRAAPARPVRKEGRRAGRRWSGPGVAGPRLHLDAARTRSRPSRFDRIGLFDHGPRQPLEMR